MTTTHNPRPEEYAPSVWEAQLYPEDTAAWAAMVTPGSAVVKSLTVLDANRMTQAGRVDALVAVDRQIAWLQARQLRLQARQLRLQARQLRVLAAMADDPLTSSPAPGLDKQWVKEDVRAALGESAVGAGARLALAKQLRHTLPDTLTALEQGRITLRHARYLGDAVAALDDDVARTVEAEVLPAAAGRDLASFRRKVKRAVLKADPRTAQDQHADALAQRRVSGTPAEHGMGTLFAYLPADGQQALLTALDLKADLCDPNDTRTKDQRGADALVQLAVDSLNGHRSCTTCAGGGRSRRARRRDRKATATGSSTPRWRACARP